MIRLLGKWLFPHDKGSARERKVHMLLMTVFGGILASVLIALMFLWVYHSDRF